MCGALVTGETPAKWASTNTVAGASFFLRRSSGTRCQIWQGQSSKAAQSSSECKRDDAALPDVLVRAAVPLRD